MVHQSWLFLILLLPLMASGQDERYYRQILTGQLPQFSEEIKEDVVQEINIDGPRYLVDLNGDGIEEHLRPQKRDGVDWLLIEDAGKRKIFEAKLLAMGAESSIFKIRLVHLSAKVKTLILFLDEGFTRGKKFESTARIFLVSFENNDFSTMKLQAGAHFFHEKEAPREIYWRRGYSVEVNDLDGDGLRDIAVHYNSIQRIHQYLGNGKWKQF